MAYEIAGAMATEGAAILGPVAKMVSSARKNDSPQPIPDATSSSGLTSEDAAQLAEQAAAKDDPMPTNPLPANGRYARVTHTRFADPVKQGEPTATLSHAENQDTFITAADDIAGYRSNAALSDRLSIPENYPKTVVEFEFTGENTGIASPVNRDYPEFVGGGATAGGAREWVIPNAPLSELPIRILGTWDVEY